eukprot:jgi/Mesvir1/27077/Mv20768-RA.1
MNESALAFIRQLEVPGNETVLLNSEGRELGMIVRDSRGQPHLIGRHGHHMHRPHPWLHEEADPHAGIIFLLIMSFMVLAQFSIFYWKKNHFRSYQLVTLMGMWIIPPIFCLHFRYWRMLATWSVFTAVTAGMVYLASRRPLASSTPRRVYGWFYIVYKMSSLCGLVGYVAIVMDVMGVSEIFLARRVPLTEAGLLFLFYGLYYGVMVRDCSAVCADRMITVLGFVNRSHGKEGGAAAHPLSTNMCALCGNEMREPTEEQKSGPFFDSVGLTQLSCKHRFHDFCIRGWTFVGKRDTCPYCKEKVEIKSMFTNPWETQSVLWSHMLDAVRYLVVWNPVIMLATQAAIYSFGFLHGHMPHGPPQATQLSARLPRG